MIVDPGFLDHWKTLMLVELLGDKEAPFYVIRLWAHCQRQRQWVFENLPPEALKALCRFPGHANKLESSLASSGFVRREGNAITALNWDEYNSSLIASWKNGKCGGRPPKKPTGNPQVTHGQPTDNPSPDREEKTRKDERREDAKFGDSPQGLAQEFCFYATRTKGRGVKADTPEDATPIMADLLKAGVTPQEISDEIKRKDRLTTEYLWEFKKRFLERKIGNQGKPSQFSGIAAAAAKAARDGTLHTEPIP